MKTLLLALLSLPASCWAQGEAALPAPAPAPASASAATPAPTARDTHAAQCVAALEASTQDLALRVKAGNKPSRALLMDRLLAGAAFVGDAYVHGATDEKQARELANQALDTQKALPPDALAARQAACAAEGGKLYAAANFVQQAVVKRLARRRMERLLGG